MAGKKGGKKQGKKKKKSDGSLIAAAIMPTAMFAAVPRTPPPPKDPPGFGLNSALLNSSMLTRMFATPDLTDDRPLSDTDTSLADYDRVNAEPGYTSAEYDRGRMPTPPNEFRDDFDYDGTDTEGLRTFDEDEVIAHTSADPLYSEVRKPKRISYGQPLSAESTGEPSLRRSTGSRHSDRYSPAMEERLEAQMVNVQQSAPGTKQSSLKRSSGADRRRSTTNEKQPSPKPPHRPSRKKRKSYASTSSLNSDGPNPEENQQPQATVATGVDNNPHSGPTGKENPVESPETKHKSRPTSLLEMINMSRNATGEHTLDDTNVEQAQDDCRGEFGETPHGKVDVRQEPDVEAIEREDEVLLEKSNPMRSSLKGKRSKKTTPVSEMLRTASPRLQSLKEQNAQLLQQQLAIQQQLQEQTQLQQQLMQRLQEEGMLATQNPDQLSTHDMGSLLQETQSVTDKTLTQQNHLIQSLQDRTAILEQEKQELVEVNQNLQAELNSMRRLSSYRDDDELASTQTSVLKKHLQDYKEEVATLKSAHQRLNVELSRYQSKYRPLSTAEKDEIPGLPLRGPKPPWLVNSKYLAPLFIAYDDQLREKDQVINQYQSELDDFHRRVDEVVKENQRLHLRLEQTDISGPISMTEWRQLQEQCKLVVEENQLLMEQLDVQQNKSKDMHKAHVQEIAKLSKKLVIAEAERGQMEQEAADLRLRYAQMKKEHDATVIENRTKLGVEEHMTQLHELKQALEEQKDKHENELKNIATKMQNVSTEKKVLNIELEDMKTQNRQMEEELKTALRTQRKAHKKLVLLQRALADAENKEQTAEQYLGTVVKMAEQTAIERDTYAHAAHKQQKQKSVAINKLMEGSLAMGKMEERLKMYKAKTSQKLEKAVGRMKDQDDGFNMQRHEYEREIKHLRVLLHEKEGQLGALTGEKRQIEDDLETMWQVASADNRRMQDTLHSSMRKLQQHGGLIDDTNLPPIDMLAGSDDEKE